ncbi:unnamed protein product, partial [Adineta ricciae]
MKNSGVNLSISPSHPRQRLANPMGTIISPVSNILISNGDLSFTSDRDHKNSHRSYKRRSVSA